MIPIGDDNPTVRFPLITVALLLALGAVWIFIQGAGLNPVALSASVCNWGMVAGEITGRARVGAAVPLGRGMACVVDADPRNILTPVTSMFLHGGWGHLLGNALFLWIFGNNVEDSMGRLRFLAFYLLCGLAAAATQVAVDPGAIVPMVGASGAISGVLGAYLMLYPRARVRVLFFPFVFWVRAWLVLLSWIGLQVLAARTGASTGVAVWAHIGGFVAGAGLIRLFINPRLMEAHAAARARLDAGRTW